MVKGPGAWSRPDGWLGWGSVVKGTGPWGRGPWVGPRVWGVRPGRALPWGSVGRAAGMGGPSRSVLYRGGPWASQRPTGVNEGTRRAAFPTGSEQITT